MTAIIDTSVWIRLFKDKSGRVSSAIEASAGSEKIVMVPPVRMELLQGCRGDAEWRTMASRLANFELIAMTPETWDGAAKIYFDLRQAGFTIRSALDCCIAQLCIEHDALLVHADRDFDVIAKARALKHERLNLDIDAV